MQQKMPLLGHKACYCRKYGKYAANAVIPKAAQIVYRLCQTWYGLRYIKETVLKINALLYLLGPIAVRPTQRLLLVPVSFAADIG